MQVRDLQEILSGLDPYQRLRIVMTGHAPPEPPMYCRFTDDKEPRIQPDVAGVVELIFADLSE